MAWMNGAKSPDTLSTPKASDRFALVWLDLIRFAAHRSGTNGSLWAMPVGSSASQPRRSVAGVTQAGLSRLRRLVDIAGTAGHLSSAFCPASALRGHL